MLEICPQFSNFGWLPEDPMSHEQEILYRERIETSDSINILHSPSSKIQGGNSAESLHFGGNLKMAKKLNHNASERDRRKRINSLYYTLRSLLPAADQMKKLSIPSTISRVLKYIPELQKEVERLVEKKENLAAKISRQENSIRYRKQRRTADHQSSVLAVSASRLGDRDVLIQISTMKIKRGSFSEALLDLDQEGILVLNASSFESFDGRVFYNLHLQVQGSQAIDVEMLKENLLSLYEKGEEILG
ncbi:transcription factor ORG2-like isoform X1 [Olea europaea subsp. europaea]|uniref:Transcription factor ORG2-like isoform X1 n=1 Tax=Olea europaea subsp. europaea TaxID=158383 RepID=A0A8S0VBQ5_OLEEU|nr:transcription factor ORG2-like isoform X1 [Olea europaea subsp. europaea]